MGRERFTLQQQTGTENAIRVPARSWLALLGVFVVLTGCGTAEPFPGLPRMSVTTQFDVENLCDMGVSPDIQLAKVPDKTAKYVVQISNINVLIQTPWREVIPASSKTEIPEGAAKTYIAPCFGDMVRFAPTAPYGYQHRIEVLAEDAENRPLGYGSTVVWVESPYITARQKRLNLQRPGASTLPPPPGSFGSSQGPYGTYPNSNFPGGLGPMNTGPYQ